MKVALVLYNRDDLNANAVIQSFATDRHETVVSVMEVDPESPYTPRELSPDRWGIEQYPTLLFMGLTGKEGDLQQFKCVACFRGASLMTRARIEAMLLKLAILPAPIGPPGSGGHLNTDGKGQTGLFPFALPAWLFLVSGLLSLKRAADAESNFGRLLYGGLGSYSLLKWNAGRVSGIGRIDLSPAASVRDVLSLATYRDLSYEDAEYLLTQRIDGRYRPQGRDAEERANRLYMRGYLELENVIPDEYSIDDRGRGFVRAVMGRMATRRQIAEGADLFPGDAGKLSGHDRRIGSAHGPRNRRRAYGRHRYSGAGKSDHYGQF